MVLRAITRIGQANQVYPDHLGEITRTMPVLKELFKKRLNQESTPAALASLPSATKSKCDRREVKDDYFKK